MTATFASLGLMEMRNAGPPPVAETPVAGIAVDSREVAGGEVFVAVPGEVLDGAEFAQYAVRKGAVAVVATPEGTARLAADLEGHRVPVFLTDNPRAALSRLAAGVWPGQPKTLVAVTGTNGKTSVADFLRQIWAHAGLAAASFGTTGVKGAGFEAPLSHTTPEPITLHRLLQRLGELGCTHCAMEASSHGLAMHRLDGVRLAAAGFTNISRDHLDYHSSFETYLTAKMRLFSDVLPEGCAAVVHDGPETPRIRQIAAARRQGLRVAGPDPSADIAYASRLTATGQRLTLTLGGETRTIALALLGAFQSANVAVAAGLALASGTPEEAIFAALPALEGVPGRMERVATRANGAQIIVDYAHTPGALETALAALRPHCTGRLVVLGGAGGDRDPGKRPLMGAAMAGGADDAIVTDDNPRGEDPAAIRTAVLQGAPEAEEIGDRAEAILAGVDMLKSEGDCLLIAGKGHEEGQEIMGVRHPFSDAEQARAAVAALDGLGD